jgi:hypothetical protein
MASDNSRQTDGIEIEPPAAAGGFDQRICPRPDFFALQFDHLADKAVNGTLKYNTYSRSRNAPS